MVTAVRTRTAAERAGHIPELDGLRGLAILLVCIFHFGFVMSACRMAAGQWLQRVFLIGWCGVDLFFTLSGFLITGILLDSLGSHNYFRIFYIRRILRIFPLYFASLAVILGLLHGALLRHRYPSVNPWWYVTYLQNWKPNHTAGDRHVDHLWSLAIEEQFYLLWPITVWLSPRRFLAVLTLTLAAVAALFRWFVIPASDSEFIYRGTLTRMDGLALGAFIAIVVRTPRLAALVRRTLPFSLLASAAVLASAFYAQNSFRWGRAMELWGASAMAAMFSLLVFWCVDCRPAAMRNGFLRVFAPYAYAIYIFHQPINQLLFPFFESALRSVGPGVDFAARLLYIPILIAVVWFLAWLSWRYFEGPINGLKRHFPYRWTPSEVELETAP